MHLITKEARLDAEQFSFYFPALFLPSPASPPLWDCSTGGWSEGRTKLFLIKHEGTFSILSHSLGDSYLWIWIPQTWSNDGVNIQYSTGYLITLVKTCLQFSRESLHNTLGNLLSTLLIKLHIFHTNLTLSNFAVGRKRYYRPVDNIFSNLQHLGNRAFDNQWNMRNQRRELPVLKLLFWNGGDL